MSRKACHAVIATICLIVMVSCSSGYHMRSVGEAITAVSGTPQSQAIRVAFAAPLMAVVTQNGVPAIGMFVTFNAPSAGASGVFANTGTTSITTLTDATGSATSGVFIANSTAGAYQVTASAQGAPSNTSFSLTNTTGATAIVAAAGSVQSAGINSTFAQPLTVKVVDGGQNPVSGVVVTYQAPATRASGTFADTGSTTTSATTDTNGMAAAAAFTANAIAGPYIVAATVSGVSTPATFNLTNLAGPPVRIVATSGTVQTAVIKTAFAAPLVASVFDSLSNPVSGASVTFRAPTTSASGTFANGKTTETDTTDVNGMATSTVFTANAITGGPYTVTATVGGVATTADFTLTNALPFKTYVFYLSGQEATTAFYALAGSVQIDSAGNVVAGVQDYNDGAFGITSPQPSGDTIKGGTLTVSKTTGQGTLTLNTDNLSLGGGTGTEILGVQFVNVNHAQIIQFDGTATSSGSMDVQTLPPALSGGYAFTLTGTDPNTSPVAFGGVFTISGGTTLQNGLLDTNDGGTVTTGSPLTGTLSVPDAFGRGTITSTINYTQIVGTPAPVALNYYVVGPEVLRIIDVDSTNNLDVTSDTAVGSAFGQGVNATTATNASLGNSIFGIIGTTLSQFGAAGMFTTIPSSASFSGIADDDELTNGLQIPASPISGTYSVAGNGYGSLTITSGTLGDVSLLGIYLTDPSLNLSDPNNTTSGLGGAVAADMDALLAGGSGILIPQTDPLATHFTGKYAFGGQAFANLVAAGEFDFVGQGTVSSGALTGTALVSDPFLTLGGGLATYSNVQFAGTPLADTSNPGHYTMSSTNPTPNPLEITISGTILDFDLAIYQASGGQLLWLNEDPSSVFLGSLQQQGSLTGLPAAVPKTGVKVKR